MPVAQLFWDNLTKWNKHTPTKTTAEDSSQRTGVSNRMWWPGFLLQRSSTPTTILLLCAMH